MNEEKIPQEAEDQEDNNDDSDEATLDRPMTIIEHLEELRRRLIICIVVLAVSAMVAYPLHGYILRLLMVPAGKINLNVLEVTEAFKVNILLSLFTGVVISFPVLAYQILKFVLPALKRRERRLLVPLVILFFVLFLGGVVFSYFNLLPVAIGWLLNQGQGLELTLSVSRYVSFVGWFLLASGVAFELPLVLLALIKVGLVDRRALRKQWQVAYMVILLLAAILTPDWSPITMMVLALPMIVLYELALLLARFFRSPGDVKLKNDHSR
ncbi:sec-independent protein translocase protein TatC [Candidatus Hakubella thermalkaliphila]|uniref:Sec-independent protein translocase protein TatC n=3 Tax=Candidatus Hakubella thermalkaliphila TaxID=2754717 RepID=A0A6V8QBF2_9ACTN|nr:twin-arginine translocase subunit TatC [Candidatus Hakubella thermalkaliphila]MBT9170978.1 Sec-independent protein translocase protein TatC [Actinomycetota bacterium]GFP26935.1 sec-independent protein translocase protein TatC [Candidatus Hakubella thermalkaliphila]GFP35594.1 sec-independent protein translocase protein TatC [Candidatus Hakubella thermalkaliphila]GFP40211.1 sec-independent protein translocase protein TatC [Candidatus Hakubella thermalkaliphila]GFP41231.1 sec-independent prote